MSKKQSKISTIIQHEFLTKVKSKTFLLSTFLAPLGIIAIIAIVAVVTIMSKDDTNKKLAVLDRTEAIGTELVAKDTSKYFMTSKNEKQLRKEIVDGELDGYILIPKDILTSGKINVYTSGGGGLGLISGIDNALSKIVRREQLTQIGADSEIIKIVEKGINIETKKVTEEGAKEDHSEIFAGIGYFLGFVIYGLMFVYGGMVMRGVIEEKANRIVEIIASSAKPFEIMMGKVLGIGLVGLLQVAIWILLGAILMAAAGILLPQFMGAPDQETISQAMQASGGGMSGSAMAQPDFVMPEIGIGLIFAFVFYFLAGYFIYATLFAAVGSAVDQEQDAAQLQIPITIPIIIPILFIANVMANPDGTLAVVLSLIPFFTPILMMVRIAATEVPVWQIALSVILPILTFLGSLWVAAKIYRVGILMYGKKPTFKDLYKWMKYKD